MKIILSNKCYLKVDKDLLARLKKNLCYEIEGTFRNAPTRYMHNYGPVARGTYWMPVERLDMLQGYDYEVIDKRVTVPVTIPKPSFTLRPDQQEVSDAINDTALLNAAPGFGKTISALEIAYKLQQKTLIVCTTTTIRDMWRKEIKKFFGFEAGLIGSGKTLTDPPIVVGNIQTLTRNSLKYGDMFGLVVVDECHHSPASTFTKLVLDSRARYKLGLSGTLHRKDGMHTMFKDFFGFNIVQPAVSNTIPPTIHKYDSGCALPGNMMIPWADRVTELTNNEMYRKEILVLINIYVQLGHKVILVSDRIEFLTYIHENTPVMSALFIGDTDLEEREEMFADMSDGELDLFCASQSIFSEGVSQNNLSCMILGSPISDNQSLLTQLAGRIMRKSSGKLDPILVDMVLKSDAGRSQSRKRSAIYRMQGWQEEAVTLPILLNKLK